MITPALRDLQASFWRALASGTPEPALLALIREQGALTADERIAIYTGMYRGRIVDVLREDFPRLAACLGDETFVVLAERYLAAHSSVHPSLRHVGRELPGFLAAEAGAAVPAWAADLARLEWARLAVFDAPDLVPLTVADLRGVAAVEWPALRFSLVPACELLVTAWPVAEVWIADREPGAPALTPGRSAYRVWREGFQVYHARMEPAEEAALRELAAGERFETICESFETAADAAAQLLRWIEDGIVVRAG